MNNCFNVPNADQRDTNGEGYSLIRDPGIDNNGVVNVFDISSWVPMFNTACGDADPDLNGDSGCNLGDFSLIPAYFGPIPPGRWDHFL